MKKTDKPIADHFEDVLELVATGSGIGQGKNILVLISTDY